jgi:hypothetical protein
MATDGGTEWSRRREMPEAAYCVPDERNNRLVLAGTLAELIIDMRRARRWTPAQKLTAIAGYANRIVALTDITSFR